MNNNINSDDANESLDLSPYLTPWKVLKNSDSSKPLEPLIPLEPLVPLVNQTAQNENIFNSKSLSQEPIIWFKTFQIKDNPFTTFEGSTEDPEDIIYIKNQFYEIFSMLENWCGILVGEPGIGKTITAAQISQETQDIQCFLSPKDIDNLFEELYNLVRFDDKNHEKMTIFESTRIHNGRCYICKKHCNKDKIPLRNEGCGFFRYILTSSEYWRLTQNIRKIIIDIPDKFVSKDTEYLREFITFPQLQCCVILLATPEQNTILMKDTYFMRLPRINIPQPPLEFFRNLFRERINFKRDEKDTNTPLPFTNEVIDYLAEQNNRNPRRFIQECNILLQKMRIEGLNEPLKITQVYNIIPPQTITLKNAIQMIMNNHRNEDFTLISNPELKQILKEKFGIKISPESLGKFMSNLGFTKENGLKVMKPDAHYRLISPKKPSTEK